LAAGAFSAAQSLENDMNVRPIVDCKTPLGEGPVWDVQEQKIYWIDSLGNKVFRANPDGSDASSHLGCGARAHRLGPPRGFQPETKRA
jgi:sugar lactone lactonase YvrE